MPLYIRLLGYKTANVTTTAQRDDVRRVLDNADDHTDETLCQALRAALAEHPKVTVWCLTILDQGTVSVFDSRQPTALLHRVTAQTADDISVDFGPPPGEHTVDPSTAQGFAELQLKDVPDDLLLSHEAFADEADYQDDENTLNFPTWFNDEQHLASVLSRLSSLITNTVATFTMIDQSFIWVELGPGRAHSARMLPRTTSTEATAIVQEILDGKNPFPGDLTRELRG